MAPNKPPYKWVASLISARKIEMLIMILIHENINIMVLDKREAVEIQKQESWRQISSAGVIGCIVPCPDCPPPPFNAITWGHNGHGRTCMVFL